MAAAVEALHYPSTPGPGGYPAATSGEHYAANASTYAHLRPNMIRRESDQILSYYQSDLAGCSDSQPALEDHNEQQSDTLSSLKRTLSSASTQCSSSEYSVESLDRRAAEHSTDDTAQPTRHSQHTRRPSVPSQESVDRRRLAIVEVDHSLPPSISRKGSGRVEAHSAHQGVSLPSALLSRRGIRVNNFALVAPPDASPSAYTDLTPPPTAPLPAGDKYGGPESTAAAHHTRSASEAVGVWTNSTHRRLRDVGIVGTGSAHDMAVVATRNSASGQPYRSQTYTDANGLQVPIFQTPTKSRSPSPANHSYNTPELHADSSISILSHAPQVTPDGARNIGEREEARTPAIGEEKDIQQPVVGPVVVGLDSNQVIRRALPGTNTGGVASPTSQYSNASRSDSPSSSAAGATYSNGPSRIASALTDIGNTQPNGPPPRPPRTLRTPLPGASPTPPSMEKRDMTALKEALQLPKSVSVVLAARSSPRLENSNFIPDVPEPRKGHGPVDDTDDAGALNAKRNKSVHKREGAFAPSDTSATPETSPQIDLSEPDNLVGRITGGHSSRAPFAEPEVVDEESDRERNKGWKLHRESSWISLKSESHRTSSPNGKPQALPERRSLSSSPSPLPPPKTSRGTGGDELGSPSVGSSSSNPFKATFNNLKRFSALPRTPSQHSLRSAKRASADIPSRTPSPPHKPSPRVGVRRRLVNAWPDAMQYRDVSAMRNPQERSAAYARKIKEFALYESGLRDWIITTQAKKPFANRSPRNSPAHPGTASSQTLLNPGVLAPIPRHVSGGSVASEATFPIRPDAYQATDLSIRPDDDLSSTTTPPSYLPYPSLAATPSRSARKYQVPLASGSSRSGTGFFASIGRKTSLKKERGGSLSLTPSSPSRGVLLKRLPDPHPPPTRPVQINNTPSIPGGPRAVPGRMGRSRTISVVPSAVPMPAPIEHVQNPVSPPLTRSETHRTSFTSRRASFFHRSTTPAAVQPLIETTNPEFEKQVDKLSDLLPHADKKVLAGYLRRAGQDVLAIGQYLEDEKNGNLRYD